MAATYSTASLTTAFAANKCMLGLFNPAGSGQVIRVYRLFALNNQLVNVTGVLTNLEVRKLTACTGGTTLVPTRHDINSNNLTAGIPLLATTQFISAASWATNVLTVTFTQPTVPTLSAAVWANGMVTVTTSLAHGYTVGQWVTVAGSTPAGYNGIYVIRQVPSTTTFLVELVSNPGTYTSGATLSAGHSYQIGQEVTIIGVTPTAYNTYNSGVYTIASIPANNQITCAMTTNPGTYTSGGQTDPSIISGTNQTFTISSLYRRVIWSTDEPSNASGTTAATFDEFETFLPFGTIWSMGYADTSTEPITLRAGEGVGIINTGGSLGAADFFAEYTVV